MTTGYPLIFALALLLAAAAAAAVTPSTPPPEDCVTDLVAFSPCFAYVSAPPNRVRNHRVTSKCCNVVLEAFGTGGSNCYCHLVKQPLLFGFPLNRSRIASLPALCSRLHANASSAAVANLDSSLESICAALPPVHRSQSQGSLGAAPRSSDSGFDNDTSAAAMSPPKSAPVPSVSAPHNETRPPVAPPAPPMAPPAQSRNPSSASSTASSPPVSAIEDSFEPDCSMAAELGSIKTWFLLQVAAAALVLLSLLV